MLYALGKHGNFREEALVGWTSHDLMRVSLRAAVGTYNHYCWAEILDKVPTGTCDGEDVCICADVSEDLKGSVMLEKQIHFYTDTTNVLEHVRKLHIFGVRAKAVKAAGEDQYSSSYMFTGCAALTYHDHQSAKYGESVQTPLANMVDRNDWNNNGSMHATRPLHV